MREHPYYPVDTLRAVLAWADDVRARADTLEHNERVVLERGRQRLSQAGEYLMMAVVAGPRGGSQGDSLRLLGHAQKAVEDAMAVFSGLLQDGIVGVTIPLERVRSRAHGARLAHREIAAWIREDVEASAEAPGSWSLKIPPRTAAIAAVYRASHFVALCGMREDPAPLREEAGRFLSAVSRSVRRGVLRELWRRGAW